ncbi:response regulator [Altererythrobacter aurantiacus]|uniref:Response regulator n=1 Tax=Parapontixanthobacter aurantiacus TaxID=1463599 RepID=A0A844ZEJ3_9SPHN|nr:response regulator [Parapontixanthobacter aurantiacus]MXO85662.1 response regulator [Parapontixanthobacter aurantiacus]
MARILIVDADDLAGDLAADMLEQAGHICGVVPCGEAALRLVELNRPGCILLDAGLPKDGAARFVERLRAMPGGSEVPVILMTSPVLAGQGASFGKGIAGEIGKPFARNALRRVVAEVLDTQLATERRQSLRGWLTESMAVKPVAKGRFAVSQTQVAALPSFA